MFGNSSKNSEKRSDTSLFKQKPYLRTNFKESNIEEDTDLRNEYRFENLHDPISIGEPTSKKYVHNLFNDPSTLKYTTHIDLTAI